MKSLSLARPLVILVIGLPGSGKSFFARQFSEMFGAPLVRTDYIRHTLFAEATYAPDQESLVSALANNQTAELLKTQKTFIIDGGLNNRIARAATEKLAKHNGYDTLTVWVQTDEPTSRARSFKRTPRKHDDALNYPMHPDVFARLSKQLTPPQPSENTVVISGKHTFGAQARVILKKLVSPRDNDASALQRPTTSPQHPTQSNDVQPRRHSVTIN